MNNNVYIKSSFIHKLISLLIVGGIYFGSIYLAFQFNPTDNLQRVLLVLAVFLIVILSIIFVVGLIILLGIYIEYSFKYSHMCTFTEYLNDDFGY